MAEEDLQSILNQTLTDVSRVEGPKIISELANQTLLLEKNPHEYSLMRLKTTQSGIKKEQKHTIDSLVQEILDEYELPPTQPDLSAVIDFIPHYKINFTYDKQLNIFLPSSNTQNEEVTIASQLLDGEIRKYTYTPKVYTQEQDIQNRLGFLLPQTYASEVVFPFIKQRPTNFKLPQWPRWKNSQKIQEKLYKELNNHLSSDFTYIGSNQEVIMIGKSSQEGFYITNDFLSSPDRFEQNIKEPLFPWQKWDERIPQFRNSPFIFPQMGRELNQKTPFRGIPDIITSSLDEAKRHFEKTHYIDYYPDMIERFYETQR